MGSGGFGLGSFRGLCVSGRLAASSVTALSVAALSVAALSVAALSVARRRIGIGGRGRRRWLTDIEVYGIGEGVGLVCGGIEVGNGKVQRVGTGLTAPGYTKRDRAERSPGVVRGWCVRAVPIQALLFAVVCVRLAGTMQHVEAIRYGSEFVLIVAIAVVVFIIAGEICDSEAGVQVIARLHDVVYQVNISNGRGGLGVDGLCAEQKCYSQVAEEQHGQNKNRFPQTHSALPKVAPLSGLDCHSRYREDHESRSFAGRL